MERAAPLLRYLQTSASLKEVKVASHLNLPQVLPQLGRAIFEAIKLNLSVEIVDVCDFIPFSTDSLILLLTSTTSITTLTFMEVNVISEGPAVLRQITTALGVNRTIKDVTIDLSPRCRLDHRLPPSLELDEPLLLQLGTHPTLQRLCLATRSRRWRSGQNSVPLSIEMDEPLLLGLGTHSTLQRLCLITATSDDRLDMIHVEAIVALLLSTQTLQHIELRAYDFDRQTLCLFWVH